MVLHRAAYGQRPLCVEFKGKGGILSNNRQGPVKYLNDLVS